ncbi:hypothetical protein I316_00747 [Kwoniella heveanensis BCC8398]|uniref:Exonuclease domain-containing protein n=1 Tax=Kwoniella heveanensis BCC8398 TaxID=1296120 RepID=A0A1B9H2Y4_9TREE|nr:hypothetical protein I316_00747 [Kwoniella heveanensis BCC8398]
MSEETSPSSGSKRKSPPLVRKDQPPSEAPLEKEDGDGFTKILTKDEKRKQRKVNKHRPGFQYNTLEFRYGKKIGIAHVRDLVLYIVAEANKPQWINVEHKTFISHTVLLFVPGLLPVHLGLEQVPMVSSMPFSTTPSSSETSTPASAVAAARVPIIPKLFTYACPTRAPGDDRKLHSVLNTLLMSPMPEALKKKKEQESRDLAELARADNTPPFLYLLSPHQMIDNDYALPSSRGKGNRRDDPWVETPEAKGMPANGRYPILAMDCEMVVSEDGQELARVSVIDYESGENVFDELVKPPKDVIDYRTQWSGITAERLTHATHTLASVQSALLTGPNPLITPHTILLGHSLECDLTALRIRHPLCIDTALIYKHPKGPPYKSALRWLASKWLKRTIQDNEKGHDSEEDARTCVDLLKMKLLHGPDFGNALENMEPIFERLNRCRPDKTQTGKTSAYIDYGNPRGTYGAKATTAIKCSSDDEVVENMLREVEGHDLVFGRFMELASVQGWNDRGVTETYNAADLDPALERFNARLSTLHSALPSNTALIVVTGHSDPLPMLKLTARRQKWERLVKTLGSTDGIAKEDRWLSEDDRELERATGQAREGMAFFCVKS